MKKLFIAVALVALGAVGALVASRCHIKEGGGAFAYSPDGNWLAEISDGYSKAHQRPYAVVRMWDIKKYPSLKDGIQFDFGKSPTIQLEFPQAFHARDDKCRVTWQTNSSRFFIEFLGSPGRAAGGDKHLRDRKSVV